MIGRAVCLLVLAGTLLAPAASFANCSVPTGTAGDFIYNSTYNVAQYCNGTNWINMGTNVGGIGTLTSPDLCTTDGTNVNCTTPTPLAVTLGGTGASSLANLISLTADVSGVLGVANGGTGASLAQGNGSKVQLSTGSATTNDCVKFDASGNTVDAGSACGSGGTAAVASGGTGDTTLTAEGILYGNGTSAAGITAAGAAGYLLQGNGSSTAPSWTNTPSGVGALMGVWSSSSANNYTINFTGSANSAPSLSGTTLTLPSNTSYIVVELWGGGGGGSGSTNGTAGGGGGTSCFGTTNTCTTSNSIFYATGGNGGNAATNATGGTGSGGDINLTGQGSWGGNAAGNSAEYLSGGNGGSAPRGGGGGVGITESAGGAGGAYGGGGGGGGLYATSGYSGGVGGGGGGYASKFINSLSSTYYFTIGGGGTAGTAGSNGGGNNYNGGAGGNGGIMISVHR